MSLLDSLKNLCDRLAPLGWGDFLLAATGGELEIRQPTTQKLEAALLKELSVVKRALPGLEDFAAAGKCAITPGLPAQSLLYHALASPLVLRDHQGKLLQGFATPAELDIVENYIFAASKTTLPQLLEKLGGKQRVAIVPFSSEYRPASETIDGHNADLVFSRTGVGRVGTSPARYAGRERGFWPEDEDNPHRVRTIPVRFSLWLAVKKKGSETRVSPILDNDQAQAKDEKKRDFWVPVHKLFAGPECLAGLSLTPQFTAALFNLKIQRVHKQLKTSPLPAGFPYVLQDAEIASWSADPALGPGWLAPTVHKSLVQPALVAGKPVTFPVTAARVDGFAAVELPGKGNFNNLEINPGPSYVHARMRVKDGMMKDLNDEDDVLKAMRKEAYDALHYVDFTGEGAVQGSVPELTGQGIATHPAYVLISAPDPFPATGQFQLSEWSRSMEIPAQFQGKLWSINPTPLSETRLPGNLQLPGSPFRAEDATVTAIVGMGAPASAANVWPRQPSAARTSVLPDDAAGVFAPGWDVGVDRLTTGAKTPHLAAYALGSPFPEDAKLCAALSTFWPAVAPDVFRTFATPIGNTSGTIAPLTDDEIGQSGALPWDGIPGPRVVEQGGARFVELADFLHADYVRQFSENRFSMRLIAQVHVEEYEARIIAMCRVYSVVANLGDISQVRDQWLALSFRSVSSGDPELHDAQNEGGAILKGPIYRVELCENLLVAEGKPNPGNARLRRFPLRNLQFFFASPASQRVLTRSDTDPQWAAADSEA